MPTPIVRAGTMEDVPRVLDLLGEASAWIRTTFGIAQWPDRFPTEQIQRDAMEGSLFVTEADGMIVGTLSLCWSDPHFWGDRSDAGFVHRLAVGRSTSTAGLGEGLLSWADYEIIRRGRAWLCADVIYENTGLRSYYERLGFEMVGEVSGDSAHPSGATPDRWRAGLYQRLSR
jgi:hypothetical protein